MGNPNLFHLRGNDFIRCDVNGGRVYIKLSNVALGYQTGREIFAHTVCCGTFSHIGKVQVTGGDD